MLTKQQIKTMKTSNQTSVSKPWLARFNTCLATIVGIGMLTLGTACFIASAQAGPPPGPLGGPPAGPLGGPPAGPPGGPPAGPEMAPQPDVAELLQLAADFHGALSYGGDITAMMSLWADDCSLTFNNGTPYVGKAAVQSFFQTGGYFLNNWVSLAPEYKTVITIHGNTAEISTQCVAIDLNASPMVVKSVIQVNATCEKIRGQWLFTSMNNTSGAPL
jgi:ketosteroid isomerase-like protein